jgi:rubrerythrin
MSYEHLGLRLPEIGRVKIGQKGKEKTSKNGKKFQMPEKLDYFKVCTLTRGADNNLELDKKAHEILGEKPRVLTVRPISSKLEENIQAGFALYSKSGDRLCYGDGKEAVDVLHGAIQPCPCREYEENRCKKYAKANFFLDKVGGVGGVHTMTIRGKITVPALVGSLKFLTEVCESGDGSIAGVPLELRLNEVMTKYGKVYSPYFLFPGSTEELISAAKKSAGLKFQVLGEESLDDADETEDEESTEPEKEVSNVSSNKSGENLGQVPDPKSKPEKSQAKTTKPATEKAKSNTPADTAGNNSDPVAPAKKDQTAAKDDSASKPLKAFWCDSCYKIANDYVCPGVCACGNKKFNESKNMKAAQEAITKHIKELGKSSSSTAKKPAADKKIYAFWCDSCHEIVEGSDKPETCGCGVSHFHMAINRDAAEKAIAAMTPEETKEYNYWTCKDCGWNHQAKKAPGECESCGAKKGFDPHETMMEGEAVFEKKQLANDIKKIAGYIKDCFGSSNQASICKQISMILDRKIEASADLDPDEEVPDLLEMLATAAEIKVKDERKQFIEAWKQARKPQQEAAAA